MRPSWDEYFLDIATVVGSRSTCPRRHVGAVLVRSRQILATGYNGSVRGQPHCDTDGCQLAEVNGRQSCTRTVHAEVNAVLSAAKHGMITQAATLYCTTAPCLNCFKALAQAGVWTVVYRDPYDVQQEIAVQEIAADLKIQLRSVK